MTAVASPGRRWIGGVPTGGLTVPALCLATLAIAPLLYGFVAFHGAYWRMAKPGVERFVIFSVVANLAVISGSAELSGRLDQRLSNVFRRTAIVHGTLAFLVLVTRHYFSIPMLLTGPLISAAGGAGVMALHRRASIPRLGIVGPWHWIAETREIDGRMLSSAADPIGGFDLILITFDGSLPPEWTPLLSRALLAGKPVRHVAEFLEEVRGIVSIDDFDLDFLPQRGLASYSFPKRLFDIACVLAAAPLALPLLALAALAIMATMGAPVFFIQDRVGLGGAPFRMLKLRTMRPQADSVPIRATVRRDPRITPLGAWLRRFRVDEIPQLWNVLVGDMSLIGPRPEQPALAERYTREVPAFAFRALVRPGITGWAQVRAAYAADLAETRVKLAYDLFYLKNFSFGLDVQILARTVWTLISGGGVR